MSRLAGDDARTDGGETRLGHRIPRNVLSAFADGKEKVVRRRSAAETPTKGDKRCGTDDSCSWPQWF
jgi:hypothetical protein